MGVCGGGEDGGVLECLWKLLPEADTDAGETTYAEEGERKLMMTGRGDRKLQLRMQTDKNPRK